MMRWIYFIAAVVELVGLTEPTVTLGQEAEAAADGTFRLADQARQRGIKAYDEGRFADASDAFNEANKLLPSWKLLYNIAQSNAAAKRYGLALEAFEKYLSDGGDEISVTRGDEVRKEIERLKVNVGYLEVTAPKNARIFVDSIERGTAPLPGVLCVNAAQDQTLGAELKDGSKIEKVFRIRSGQTISIDLAAPNHTAKADSPKQGARSKPDQIESSTSSVDFKNSKEPHNKLNPFQIAGWVSLGVGAAALAAGAVTGGLALSNNADLENSCENGICYNDTYDQYYRRNNLASASSALIAVGGTAAAAGIGLLVYRWIRDSRESQVTWIPAPNGLVVEGRF